MEKKVFIWHQTTEQTTNTKFLSALSSFNLCSTNSTMLTSTELGRNHVFYCNKARTGSHIFRKQKLHESMTLNDPNRLKLLCLLCNTKS